jgi:hypothetical protein
MNVQRGQRASGNPQGGCNKAVHSFPSGALAALLCPPEVLEPGRGQLGVPDRVLDVLVPEIGLKGSGVVSLGSQCEPASVPQHVRVGLEAAIITNSVQRSCLNGPVVFSGSPLACTYGFGEVGRGDFKNRGFKLRAVAQQIPAAHAYV